MREPTVRKDDGTVVPLEDWRLDGLEGLVKSLDGIVEDAVQGGDSVEKVYELFGVRAYPGVLSLLRQLPKLIEELRKAREGHSKRASIAEAAANERQARKERKADEPKGLYGKYVVFHACDVNDDRLVADPVSEAALTGCFVLRPENDYSARRAIMVYAAYAADVWCEDELAHDLRTWIKQLDTDKPL